MMPSIDDRLDSVVRALVEVVIPALPADRSLAIEQAHLVLAQIGIVREQVDLAPLFERREAEATVALGRTLADLAEGGAETARAAAALRASIEAATLDGPAAVRRATGDVGQAIEMLIEASGADGSDAFRSRAMAAVLDAGRAAGTRDRAWNRAAGFEADASALPAIEALLGT